MQRTDVVVAARIFVVAAGTQHGRRSDADTCRLVWPPRGRGKGPGGTTKISGGECGQRPRPVSVDAKRHIRRCM
jgi:hypothetical protein